MNPILTETRHFSVQMTWIQFLILNNLALCI